MMKRAVVLVTFAALGAAVFEGACSRQAGFWGTGEYTVWISQPPGKQYLVEFEEALGPSSDSVEGIIRVEAVRGDSIFGSYDIPLIRIGLTIGGADSLPTAHKVAGVTAGNGFALRLDADVVDGSLWLRGRVERAELARGSWHDDPRLREGTFLLRGSVDEQ